MIESSLAQRARTKSIPWSAHLELTYACNWRCVFCYNPRHHDVRRVTLVGWLRVLDSLRRLGTLNLTLTGGEPLANRDFFAIAGAARKRAFAVRMFTNGALIGDDAADQIAALDPLAVELSVHGATAAVHDRTTATPGSFEAMWSGIDRLARRNVRVVLKTPVTRINEHELDAIIQLCAERGFPLRLDGNITPRDDGDMSPLGYAASVDARRRIMQIAAGAGSIGMLNRVEGAENCGIGRITIVVDPEGNVYPCMQWRQTALGNVHDDDLENIWRTSRARQSAIAMSQDANDAMARRGGVVDALPFCPALAMQRTGSPVVPDPEYLANAAIAHDVLTRS